MPKMKNQVRITARTLKATKAHVITPADRSGRSLAAKKQVTTIRIRKNG